MFSPQQKNGNEKNSGTAKEKSAVSLVDNRPQSVTQRKLWSGNGDAPVQKKENSTGLPDNLKSGIENLSGHSMDDVKVHYNSSQPAQLNAHAYAQGNQIHVASGQEKHLAHEAWHVVQQKQGRVKPTKQLKEKVNVNDDKGLEKEADVMGAKALQLQSTHTAGHTHHAINITGNEPVQRKLYHADKQSAKEIDPKIPVQCVLYRRADGARTRFDLGAVYHSGGIGVGDFLRDIGAAIWYNALAIDGNFVFIARENGTHPSVYNCATGGVVGLNCTNRAQLIQVINGINNVNTLVQLFIDGASGTQLLAIFAAGQNNGAAIHTQIGIIHGNNVAHLVQLYEAGATSAQIDTLLGHEPHGDVLAQQIQNINAHNVDHLIRLYAHGATSAQIDTLLGHDNNGTNLHIVIGRIAGPNIAHLIQLYADGATTLQIFTLTGHDNNGANLHHLITRVTGHNVAQLIQLYTDGATSAQINTLLGHQPNAATLHNQIQAVTGHNVARLIRLYNDGLTSAQITAFLAVDGNAQRIHLLIQPIPGAFGAGNIVFASLANGRVGSIYFHAGRIRLTHNNGPEINVHAYVERYTISNAHYLQYRAWKNAAARTPQQRYNYVRALPSCQVAVAGAGQRLIEFFGIQGANGSHPSRGGPVVFGYALSALQMRIIYNAANTNNNATLRRAVQMCGAGIPMN